MKELYYIYNHIDPQTGEIMYIGIGTGSRAWATGTSSGTSRSEDHTKWITDLYYMGYTMADVAVIIETMLDRPTALQKESSTIKLFKPLFNKQGNPDVFKAYNYTEEHALRAVELLNSGVRLYQIPGILGIYSSNKSVTGARLVSAGNNILNRKNK
jgi:hypothetical protein